MLYVIGEHRTGVVKIGTAVNPVQRLRDVQTCNPTALSLHLVVSGGPQQENALHRLFADKRVRGEWFDFGDEDAVTAVLAVPGNEPVNIHTLVTTTSTQPTLTVEDLLIELPMIFGGVPRVSSRDIVTALTARGWPFTSSQHGGKLLATTLRTIGVAPRTMRFGGRIDKGYEWKDLARHCV